MKHTRTPAAVTSLPQSPQDEVDARVRRYWITMGIRMSCFALTVLVTPYGWYTWVFAIAAAVLPYIAVVFANAASPTTTQVVESPMQQLTAAPTPETAEETSHPSIITIVESPTDLEEPKDSDR